MAVASRAVTVTTAATRLDSTSDQSGESAVAVYNNSTAIVYLGPSGVTTSSGVPVAAGAWSPSISGLDATEGIYGIVGSGTAEVRVLEVGV